ncbi:MAG: serine protease [Rhizobiaceae bacterium MnEN-MB40S]|nr:MAG: serine protease [Rhizobiaceae bacterium MnEN-MB40S]
MADSEDDLDVLRRKVAALAAAEGAKPEKLVREATSAQIIGDPALGPSLESSFGQVSESAQLEAVIRWSRPVFWVTNDAVDDRSVDANGPGMPGLMEALNDSSNRSELERALPSIGRIEIADNANFEWAGTGWVIDFDGASDIVVTNAHVANLFARRGQAGFVFKPGIPNFNLPQSAKIDFREELGGSVAREFPVTEIIWISQTSQLDVAFLRVSRSAGTDRLSGPLPLTTDAQTGAAVAVIGYPGDDSRSYDARRFKQVFGMEFGIKRLALGRVTDPEHASITHDCSTLPGNSGSIVWDLEKKKAIGLHYAGAMFRNNYAVPAAELEKLARQRPWQGEAPRAPMSSDTARPPMAVGQGGAAVAASSVTSDGAITLTVPLEITVKLGVDTAPQTVASDAPIRTDKQSAEAAANAIRAYLAAYPDDNRILQVNAGFLFKDGQLSDDYGVIIGVRPGASLDLAAYGLQSVVDGVEVVAEFADPEAVAEELLGYSVEAFTDRRARYSRDLSDPRFNLDPVSGKMKMTLHVSPECGWPVLKQFLAIDDYEQLTIGMYHVTAPHVVEAIEDIAGRRRSRITLTLDRQRGDKAENPDDTSGEKKKDDIPERDTIKSLETTMEKRFKWVKAALGANSLFATAYHIKVAVWTDRLRGDKRSDKALWLSSGNWQSTNQANIDKPFETLTWRDVRDFNREWHAVVWREDLAATFRRHLEQDYEDCEAAQLTESETVGATPDVLVPEAIAERPPEPTRFQVFAPLELDEEMTVQPLLTPDNYPEVVLDLVESARERLLIENQSFNLWSKIDNTPEHFLAIARAIRKKQQAGLDVRIIFRNLFGSEKTTLRRLKEFGMRTDADHIRYFDTCHTKGMIVDDHTVMLGSQNFTAGGTGPNRDASLVIRNARANAYFASLFEYDWSELARNRWRGEAASGAVRFVTPGAESATPAGYRRISLAEYLGES